MYELSRGILKYLDRIRSYEPWTVIAQLLLIGLVVWWAVRFLRGTRGASLIKGAGVLLGVVYLGIRLLPKTPGWEPIEFLYGKFLLLVFVATVVAFQPELRRALGQIGRAHLFGSTRQYLEDEIDVLIESAGYFSRNKIGAIVAIERKIALGPLMETGTRLDAELTSPLINTIFHPGTQLHDMGVVVQNGRLAAAGCQFPLAESDEVDITLGSRHRAALGLAKDTDAIIVVVSEQTGRISVAMDGQLSVGLDLDALRELLRSALSVETKRLGNWRRLFGKA